MRFAISPNERRIEDLVRLLDHDERPVAETWRAVGTAAGRLGLARPSYGHVRRLVRLERALAKLREEERSILAAAGVALLAGRVPHVHKVIDDVSAIREREWLVFQEHKPSPEPS